MVIFMGQGWARVIGIGDVGRSDTASAGMGLCARQHGYGLDNGERLSTGNIRRERSSWPLI